MSASSPLRDTPRSPLRLTLLLALVAPALLAGCSSDTTTAPPSAAPTPISRLDSAKVAVSRGRFCDRVPASAVRAAVGAKPTTDQSWADGEPGPKAGSGEDVSNEFGCSWGDGTTTVQAWVFARPVDAALAGRATAAARREAGCTVAPAATFGSPGQRQTCTGAGVTRVRYAGLFDDAWVTCQVSAPASADQRVVTGSTGRWCVQVLDALGR